MSFEALSYTHTFKFEGVPPEWQPLIYAFDPDLPLFPLLYFHVLQKGLSQRPKFGERAFGYIRSVEIDVSNSVLSAVVVCNKNLSDAVEATKFKEAVQGAVADRLGISNPVGLTDVAACFPSTSKFAAVPAVLTELWHRVVDAGYGGTLPFGRFFDPVLGLARYYASFNTPQGGRKAEFIQTHYFASRFGERISTSSGIPRTDFYLLPTWDELVDIHNPLSLFPKYESLVRAAKAFCSLPYFSALELENWSYTGVRAPTGQQYNKAFYDVMAQSAGNQHSYSLRECFNAFNKGAPRTIIFLMALNDFRQIGEAAPMPLGSSKPRINPAAISAKDAADIILNMSGYQSPKVISIYAQQCHRNSHSLPIDTWIGAFLEWPIGAVQYDVKHGSWRDVKANRSRLRELISSGVSLGKVERLLWVAAQARKVHSATCDDALWCVKQSGEFAARGANPLSCKACLNAVRNNCPAFVAIKNTEVVFNAPGGPDQFVVETSAGDETTPNQRILRTRGKSVYSEIYDEDTVDDSAKSFGLFPPTGHVVGAPITVEKFVNDY